MAEPKRPDWGDMNLWAMLQRALGDVNRAEQIIVDNTSVSFRVARPIMQQLQDARRELGEAALALAERAERRES